MKRISSLYWMGLLVSLLSYGYIYWHDSQVPDRARALEQHMTWTAPPASTGDGISVVPTK